MPSYYDSSVLLAGLLDQPGREDLVPLWDEEEDRVSSILLEAECVTVLRRAATLQPRKDAGAFLASRLERLDAYLKGIALRSVDPAVMRQLKQETRLAKCRSLDAIHLATALLYQEQCEERLRICTLDESMRELAACLEFEVAPL